MKCQVENCSRPVLVKSAGLCKMHYHRMRRTGQTGGAEVLRTSGPPETRWMEHVSVESPGCWIWTGSLDRHGYGQIDVRTNGKRKNWRAHRWVYTVMVRPLEDHETIDHLCRVHRCVNPDHMDPVPHATNVQRGAAGTQYSNRDRCKYGHPFSPENTRTTATGRVCITCEKERHRTAYAKRRNPNAIRNQDRTHCPKGHEYSPENTYIPPRGGRSCRECTRAKGREAMRRKRAASKE